MPPLEVWAYPVLLLAFLGTYHVGRHRPRRVWDAFEWARSGALAFIVGTLLAITQLMVSSGMMSQPRQWATVSLAAASVIGMVAIHILESFAEWRGENVPDEESQSSA